MEIDIDKLTYRGIDVLLAKYVLNIEVISRGKQYTYKPLAHDIGVGKYKTYTRKLKIPEDEKVLPYWSSNPRDAIKLLDICQQLNYVPDIVPINFTDRRWVIKVGRIVYSNKNLARTISTAILIYRIKKEFSEVKVQYILENKSVVV